MSTIIIDTITGKSTATTITIGSTPVVSASANSLTIRGEGSNQTSVQQGLSKHWVNIDGDTPSARDSFNNASLTDNGSGNYTITRTNNFSAVNYCCQGGGNSSASGDGRITALDEATLSTSANEIFNRSDANGVQDDAHVNISFLGDLS
jgi:hypothetical protein